MSSGTPAADGDVLVVNGLARRFRDREVVRSLDLRLEPGERVALRGPNGSGKTTVLRCVAGTLIPTAGTITIGGHAAGELEARRLVGASLSQERSFYLRLTGHANLVFYARLRARTTAQAEAAVRALEEELELDHIVAERVDRCSSGMIQQLGIARALLGDPALLVLDEPTKSLDDAARERLWAAVERRSRVALLIATHVDHDVERCHRTLAFPV